MWFNLLGSAPHGPQSDPPTRAKSAPHSSPHILVLGRYIIHREVSMRLSWIAATGVIASVLGWPQTPEPPQFEVASIRPSPASAGWQYAIRPGRGGFSATNIPLSYLIYRAFKIQEYQLVGAPSWISDRYDVAAKPGASNEVEGRAMLQSL